MVLTLVQIFKVKSKAVVALIIVVVDVRSELKSLHTTPKQTKDHKMRKIDQEIETSFMLFIFNFGCSCKTLFFK